MVKDLVGLLYAIAILNPGQFIILAINIGASPIAHFSAMERPSILGFSLYMVAIPI